MMEVSDVLFAIVPILFIVVFISVFVVVIVTIVKGISSSRHITGAVDRTLSQAMDSISGGFQTLMLNNRGGVLIPQITADFPDFSPTVALGCAKEAVRMKCSDNTLTVGNAVISDYTHSADKSTVVIEVSAASRVSGNRKYIVLYENTLEQNVNCPHCGAPLKDSVGNVCAYCGSQIEKAESGGWKVSSVMAG